MWYWATARVIWGEGKDISFVLVSCKICGCFPAQHGHWEGESCLHLHTSPPDALGNYLCTHSAANPHSANSLLKNFQQEKHGPYICRCLLLHSENARSYPCYPKKGVSFLSSFGDSSSITEQNPRDRILQPPPANLSIMMEDLKQHPGNMPQWATSLPQGSSLLTGDVHITLLMLLHSAWQARARKLHSKYYVRS